MACIDIFTKYAVVVPIRSKQIPDFLAGLMECLTKMKKKPTFIYSDEEGALTSNDVQGYLKKEKIEVIMTRNHAHFVERFIRTFKMMLRKRIDNDMKKGDAIQWSDYIFQIMLTYNNKNEHSSIEMTPNEATKPDKAIEAEINMKMKARRDRIYPNLVVGDRVKIMLKYSKGKKEHNPSYSDTKYAIEKIVEKQGLKFYTVNGRERQRNELMKV